MNAKFFALSIIDEFVVSSLSSFGGTVATADILIPGAGVNAGGVFAGDNKLTRTSALLEKSHFETLHL